jgi:hypothetical protein
MSQISKKFLKNDSVDETKILLDSDGALASENAAGTGQVDILKSDADDIVQLLSQTQIATTPAEDNDVANKVYVDSQIASGPAAAVAAEASRAMAAEATNAAAIAAETSRATADEATYLPLAGGSMSGAISMSGSQINNLADPVIGTDAANMEYVTSSVATETMRAEAAESALGSQEASDVYNLQGQITTAVNQEASDVSNLQGQITAAVNQESSDVSNLQGQITAAVNQEASDVSNLENLISDETTRATAAEGVNAAAISAETTRATAAEGVNASAIAAETSRATAAEGVNASAIAAETSRATAAEGVNASAIAAETSRATAAEGVNASAIAAETSRAEAAEATYLPLAGGTMSGDLDMGSNSIDNVTDPTLAQQAATMHYVDQQVAASAGALSWRAASVVISGSTTLNGAAEGATVASLLPLSDDTQPTATVVIGDFVAGSYILYNNGASSKLIQVYSDSGTLKITYLGFSALAQNSTFLVDNDLSYLPNTDDGVAIYAYVNSAFVRLGSLQFNFADGINIATPFTPSAGVVAAGDTVQAAIEKMVANLLVEVSRAEAAEATNASAISAETTRATAAEGVNAAAIAAETTRATAAEALAANQSLSNLTSTAINQGLIPNATGSLDLGSETLVWNNLYANYVNDISGDTVLDVQARQLLNSSGNNLVDFENSLLNYTPGGGHPSVDWQNSVLYAPGSVAVINWLGQVINDDTGAVAIDWNNRYLYDNSGSTVIAVDFGNHLLSNDSGATVVDFSGTEVKLNAGADANSNNIINVLDPVNPQDAATKNYVDSASSSGSAAVATETSRAMAAEATNAAAITAETSRATAAEALAANQTLSNLTSPTSVNQSILPSASGTLDLGSGPLKWGHVWATEVDCPYFYGTTITLNASTSVIMGAPVNMEGYAIKSVLDPVNPQDAATKNYVDSASSSSSAAVAAETSRATAAEASLSSAIAAVHQYTPVKQKITLASGDITNQYVDLANLAMANSMMVVVSGVIQSEGDDYSLSTVAGVTRVTFLGDLATGGNSALVAGDVLSFQYGM